MDQGPYGPPGTPSALFRMRHFGPPPSMYTNKYGFSEPPRFHGFQRGRRWANPGRGRGGGHFSVNGNNQKGSLSPLKRDHSTMVGTEGEGPSANISPAEKVMRFQESDFQTVKKISKNSIKKHRKAAQKVKLPPGTVNTSLPTFEAQAVDLISKMELSDEHKRGVQQVLLDLTTVLRTVIEDIDPVVYGSMSTGLAFGTSDIDCYMESKVVPDGAERMALLLRNRKVLYRSMKFDYVLSIPKARVPILKAYHNATGIEVDLNCTTCNGVHNSALIKYLIHIDDRVRQLAMLIQIFYRSCEISGTNKVTSYVVTLLVLYYFQRLEHPIIPPLYKILYVGEGQTWPASFERSIYKYVDITQNKMTLTELFSGYFKFYAAFDFTKVISLYLGRELELECFTPDYDKLPEELAILKTFLANTVVGKQGFLDKHMMIQDPIEHHLNTTWNVPLSCFELFNSLNQRYYELTTKKPECLWLVNMRPKTEGAELNQNETAAGTNLPALPPMFLQRFPPVTFNVAYPLEGFDTAWPQQLIPDFTSVFSLLLLEQSVNEGDAKSQSTILFNLETHYNIFKTRFKSLHMEVVSDPSKYDAIKTMMMAIKDRMKKPEASFCATLAISRAENPNELRIHIQDENKNCQNVFAHFARNLQDVLSDLLRSVRTLKSSTSS